MLGIAIVGVSIMAMAVHKQSRPTTIVQGDRDSNTNDDSGGQHLLPGHDLPWSAFVAWTNLYQMAAYAWGLGKTVRVPLCAMQRKGRFDLFGGVSTRVLHLANIMP